jgi:formylglycine-generating enzyme required for sulfatase activity
MKTSIMNFLGLSAACLLPAAIFAADIEQVIVRQQWPWSTDVHVEYKLSGVTDPVDISVEAYNGGQKLDSASLDASMTGRRHGITKSGVGTIVIDPVKAFGTEEVSLGDFRVKLTVSDSVSDMDEVLYKIFDLTNGECTDVTRGELLDRKYGSVETDFGNIGEGYNTSLKDVVIWTGVTNDVAYKTTKLVMRKIPAKGVTTRIGKLECQTDNALDSSAIRQVSFTNDYYMSVFEFTDGQYHSLVTNTAGSTLTALGDYMKFLVEPDRYLRPVNVPIHTSRYKIGSWPGEASCLKGEFANNTTTIIGIMRLQTGLLGFDLPTEAVWEYACRAGTTNDCNNGLNYTDNSSFKPVARYTANSNSGSENLYELTSAEGGSAIVGSYHPNAWGLYDMHGNLAELCLDYYQKDVSAQTGVDPWGPELPEGTTSENTRVLKGGSYLVDYRYVTSSSRTGQAPNSNTAHIGIRICLTEY